MSAAVCTIAGNADVYGLGIRLSFYLLWFAVLIGERFREHHAKVLRGAELVLAYAVFLGLAMTTSSGHLFAAEVYVALLLISTTVYLLVPRHTSDLVAWIRPDLGLGAQHAGFGIVAAARCLFVLIVVGLQMWFWGTGVESAAIDRVLTAQGGGCQPPQQFGFGFGPVDLRLGGFRALNVLLMLALLAGGVVVGAMKAGVVGTKKSRRRRRSKYVKKLPHQPAGLVRHPDINLTITDAAVLAYCARSKHSAASRLRAFSSPPSSCPFDGTGSRLLLLTKPRPPRS